MPTGIYKRPKGFVPKSIFKKGYTPWNKGKKMPTEVIKKLCGRNNHNFGKDFSGNKAPSWKGGKRLSSGGYILIYSPSHKFSNNAGYVLEHRLVMEEHLGRYLNPEEIVHHINGIKDDNKLLNLQLFANGKRHLKYHYPRLSKIGKNQQRKGGVM